MVGLLFVAISVSAERLARAEASAQLHRIRAYAALVAFTNALAVSLFALIPGDQIGMISLIMAIIGLLFVMAALLSLVRLRAVHWTAVQDALFVIGLATAFIYQLVAGVDVVMRPGDSGSVETIAVLVVVCFLVGIARAWELIGGPTIGFRDEVIALVRGEGAAAPGDADRSAENAASAEKVGTAEHQSQPPA